MDRAKLVERALPSRTRLTVPMAHGFGKTTLLAECCRPLPERGIVTAWIPDPPPPRWIAARPEPRHDPQNQGEHRMHPHALRTLSIAAAFAGTALAGCGGGGGMTGTGTPVEPPTEREPASLAIPAGMSASAAPGVTAQSTGDTIASLLPDPGRQFAPVSARSRMDEFRVTAISSDGDNGFRVTYVVDGQEREVHFQADDFGADPRSSRDYHTENEEGARFWLYSPFGSFNEDEKNQGSPNFEYLDVYSSGVGGYGTSNRQYLAFGARTDAANLPTGTAGYSGYVEAESNPLGSIDPGETRGRMAGSWRLTADLSESSLRGHIRRVRMRAAGERTWRTLPHTTYFRIENGQIVDGRFAASVSGVDSDPSAPAQRTLAGYEGDMLGEFYGPGAEEAGGVLRATRASDERVLAGGFAGKRVPEFDPSFPDGILPIESVGVNRDYDTGNVRLLDDAEAEVTAIESDGASGFHVTYRVDGIDHRVHLAEPIYLNPEDEFGLFRHQGAGGFFLFDQTGSFMGTPEFSYFDVHGWAMERHAADGVLESVLRGFVVSGVKTEASDLPAGTATYAGRAHFLTWPSDNPRLAAGVRSDGRLTLNADFGASTVGGTIDRISNVPGSLDAVAIEYGMIQGAELTADLRGAAEGESFEGSMTGWFFGPGAAEVGGELEGDYTGEQMTAVVQGWFGGEKQ